MADLSVSHITHHYEGRNIINDVSFTAKAGELTCLMGPSGCGKTTLLRLIAGLESVQQGDILLNQQSVTSTSVQQRGIGMVFQHPSLFPHLTVEQNIAFGIQDKSASERKHMVDKLLMLTGLLEHQPFYPHQLSGGQQQRAALARALAPEPKAMLLDEPFANLDYSLRQRLLEEVTTLLKEYSIPVIMVTHDPQEALQKADHIVVLSSQGSVSQTGDPQNIVI